MSQDVSVIKDSSIPILIVDDSQDYAKMLERLLRVKCGYQNITVKHSTAEAWELFEQQQRFSLLFVDYNFPVGESGTMFLQRLAQRELMEGTVAFLITSEPTLKNMEEAQQAGAAGVVAKPFDIKQLLEHLDRAARKLFSDSLDCF
jgi:CheY-like chemotaxis protein